MHIEGMLIEKFACIGGLPECLNLLAEKYKTLASTNKKLSFKRLKLGMQDIATLRARLTSHTVLLTNFIQKFDTLYFVRY